MKPLKETLTPGQVAKVCHISPRMVNKWVDTGLLEGYRLPGSRHRRIPREALIRFLREHNMPLGELEQEVAT